MDADERGKTFSPRSSFACPRLFSDEREEEPEILLLCNADLVTSTTPKGTAKCLTYPHEIGAGLRCLPRSSVHTESVIVPQIDVCAGAKGARGLELTGGLFVAVALGVEDANIDSAFIVCELTKQIKPITRITASLPRKLGSRVFIVVPLPTKQKYLPLTHNHAP